MATSPTETIRFDLAVIGTGGAGMAAAIKGAELGRSVALIEAGTLGGTCVNVGCIPSKTLVRAAEAYERARRPAFAGLQVHADGVDWSALMRHKDGLVEQLRQHKYRDVLAAYQDYISLWQGRACLQADGAVAVEGGPTLAAERVVVATGASPHMPAIEGIEDVEVLTSKTAMELAHQPRSLLVVGGGSIGVELGQTLARLGTEMTLLQRNPYLLPGREPALTERLAGYLRAEGLQVVAEATPVRIAQDGGDKVVTARVAGEQKTFRAEHVLMATGRAPNTQDLGLAAAGVACNADGAIAVSDTLQTSQPHVYAAGDVTDCPKLVYVAAAGGGIAAENALQGDAQSLDLAACPEVVFSDPQVATVGLTAAQARERGYNVKTATLPLSEVPRALVAGDTRGAIHLVADAGSDRLLGAHVLAAEGGEVVQAAALALQWGATVRDLRRTLFPYLVQVEGLKLAAQAFETDPSKLSCCAG